MDKTAIVEFGNCEKTGWVALKGELPQGEQVRAHVYWYPDDITTAEALGELADLSEHYETVVVVTPMPKELESELYDIDT